MPGYYTEVNHAIKMVRTQWIPKIANGQDVHKDLIKMWVQEKFECSSKPVIDYLITYAKQNPDHIVVDGDSFKSGAQLEVID